MNYLKIYCNLIRMAESRTAPEGYVERHHIFPVSIYGKNRRIVKLTAREHYFAHALLEKIFIKRYGEKDQRTIKMIHAFYCMNTANRKNYYNSFLYESSRIKAANIMNGNTYRRGKKLSQEHIEKIIDGNKKKIGKKMSDESRRNMSIAKKGKKIPAEQREKIAASLRGKKRTFTEEHKRKISEAAKRRYAAGNLPQLNRKGKPAWNTGIPRTEECKQKLRDKWEEKNTKK